MADDEPHAVVRLLLKRMESHPEEFNRHEDTYGDRWHSIVSDVIEYGNEADKSAVSAKLRDLRLGEAHEDMMDELVNGPERRRKEEEEREYERQMLRQGGLVQQQKAYVSQLQGMVGQVYGGGGGAGAGIVGKSYTSAIMDEYDSELDRLRSAVPTLYGDYGSITNAAVPEPTLTSSTINAIKKALGKGK
jgi:hypothetical protein